MASFHVNSGNVTPSNQNANVGDVVSLTGSGSVYVFKQQGNSNNWVQTTDLFGSSNPLPISAPETNLTAQTANTYVLSTSSTYNGSIYPETGSNGTLVVNTGGLEE